MIYRNCKCYKGENEEDYKNREEVYDLICEKCHDNCNKVNRLFDDIFGLV